MRFQACVAAAFAAVTFAATAAPIPGQGTWETTLQGRDLDGDLGNGYEAYYDTVLNVTWAANANRFFDPENYDYGRFYHSSIQYTLNNLSIHGVTGWRLPIATPSNGIEWSFDYSPVGGQDFGGNPPVQHSELAHLYYVTLGNSYCPQYLPGCGYAAINTGPFSGLGLVREAYWTSGYFVRDYEDLGRLPAGVVFYMQSGEQSAMIMEGHIFEWALLWPVMDGDVAAPIPEPSAIAAALAGFLTVLVARRRCQRHSAGANAPAHGQR